MNLIARRSRLDADLAARARWVAARAGVLHSDFQRTFSGFGGHHVVALPALADTDETSLRVLQDIRLSGVDGPRDSLPRLHGAFPFLPNDTPLATIPRFQVSESDGGSWLCVVASDGEDVDVLDKEARNLLRTVAPPDVDMPVTITKLVEHPPASAYADAVANIVQLIQSGELEKVVLARSVDFDADHVLDPAAVLQRMTEREPACTRYAFPVGSSGRLVGASPELLISQKDHKLSSHPLAGTMSLATPTESAEQLLTSSKDLNEHRLVVDDLARSLSPLVSDLMVPDMPSIVTLRSVAHLGTLLTARARTGAGPDYLLELLSALHPTPAVGGVPRRAALEAIERYEGPRRNYFAGALGWLNASGDGEWVLGIRGAMLQGNHCELTAGAGVVADSTPRGEAQETRSKLRSVLEAVAPGCGDRLEGIN